MNNQGLYFLFSCLMVGLAGFFSEARAQEPLPADTSSIYRPTKEKPIPLVQEEGYTDGTELIDSVSPLIPEKAAFYSAVLPGLGQAYNDSHWKIPLIYVGGAFIAYSVNFYNRRYSENIKNLNTIILDPEVTTILVGRNPQDQTYFERQADRYRRERDYMIIMGGLLYGLNIVEAYVDAHLQDFNLNDDLSMRLKPALLPAAAGVPAAGLALTFRIK